MNNKKENVVFFIGTPIVNKSNIFMNFEESNKNYAVIGKIGQGMSFTVKASAIKKAK